MTETTVNLTSRTAALVVAAKSGDRDALHELTASHLPLLYNVIGRALNGHADVDDLVQETMERVVRGIRGLREPERFRSWVVAIAYREIQLHLRKAARGAPPRSALPDVPDPAADFAERTVTELVLTGQRRELVEATRWLDDGDRHLLALWWHEAAGDLTRTELATALGIGQPHAAVRLQRMKAQLEVARTIVRSLRETPRCAGLETVAHGWDGVARPLWRKRLARHVRDCAACGGHRSGLIAPERLLLGIGLVALPAAALAAAARVALKSPLLAPSTSLLQAFQHKTAAVATVAVVAGGGFAFAVHETPDPPSSPGQAAPAAPFAPASPAAPVTSTTTPPVQSAVAGTIVVSPSGADTGDGSVDRPFATLSKAAAVVRPGQTIALRGGTYRPVDPVTITTSGTAEQRITLTNYRDELPVIDASRIPADKWAVTQQADHWTVQGLEIKGSRSHAYVCLACKHNVFRRLSVHDNVESGLTLRDDGTVDNQVLDSDFYRNRNPADRGQTGIGLGIKFGTGDGNVVRGCRAFDNADDGFDLGDFHSPVTLEYNWAYGNGVNRWSVRDWQSNGNGFTLGGGSPPAAAAHKLRHNAAWDNIHHGFADSGNNAALQFTNNTAYRNGATGFAVATAPATLRSSVAIDNPTAVSANTALQTSRNTWDEGTWTRSMFRSTDPAAAQGPRPASGTLPATTFLTTGNGMGASMNGN
ncbi:sigma-70 family RNA polymerase sigma factor [Dactylosporangium sp. NPDC005555]|uniref:sigma-70 family RNA polymerase sigma factor n=1 Tax=Dactylosporangium sp. NPDC005555 TaxID=3154889 RepID=UPI0033BE23F5